MKVFCLGMHKTGTVSLARALEKIGMKTRHGYKPQSDLIEMALKKGLKPLEILEDVNAHHRSVGPFDAYLDLYAVRWFFPKLDEAYPGSKFILTTRDEDEWLASVHRQMEKRPDSPFFHYWYFQTDEQRIADKRTSERVICDYFAKHPEADFLDIDITQGDPSAMWKWELLCDFLDEPVPDAPFPHENKSPVD